MRLLSIGWRLMFGTQRWLKCELTRKSSSFYAIKLTNKQLIRLSGRNSVIYLQSLLTNDIRHLLNDCDVTQRSSIYAFMLNPSGKVMCDLIVYKGKVFSDGELLLEVDSSLAKALRRLLWGYNLMDNITIEAVNDIHLWTLIPTNINNNVLLQEIVSDDIQLVNDPRLPQLGYRFWSRIGGQTFADITKFIDADIEESNLCQYQLHRYKLGVSEGYDDIWSGFYFPFECNGDYLNAISVSKGLYLSEEKVFKIYMRHPIVSRIMPIKFECHRSELIEKNPKPKTLIHVQNSSTNTMGRLMNRRGFYGIANFMCKDVLQKQALHHEESGIVVSTWKPEWWPQDIDMLYFPQLEYKQALLHYDSSS